MVLGHLDLPDHPHVGRYVRTGTVCDSTVVGERWGKQQPARVAAAHWGIEHPLLSGPRLVVLREELDAGTCLLPDA